VKSGKYGTVVFEDLPPPTSEGLASQDEQRSPPWRLSRGLPELDCGQLHQLLLLDSLQPGTVHWEHNLEFAYPSDGDTKVSLTAARPSPSNSSSSSVWIVRGGVRAGWYRLHSRLI
jgi:hypothetical protein